MYSAAGNKSIINPINKPTISVICPTYNSADHVAATLGTVFSQDQWPDELIVVDDGSSDDTVRIIKDNFCGRAPIRLIIIERTHAGPGAARNVGVKRATGDWIAFLDSDDQWRPDKIATVSKMILAKPEKNFFCHDEERILLNGSVVALRHGHAYRPGEALGRQLYFENFFSTSAVVCQRSLLLEHGLFDETLMTSQDYELWLRLSDFINVCFIPAVLGRYVDRLGNITSSKITLRLRNTLKIALKHRWRVGLIMFVVKVVQIVGRYAVVMIKFFTRQARGYDHS